MINRAKALPARVIYSVLKQSTIGNINVIMLLMSNDGINDRIARNLSGIRKEQRYTQKDLAIKAGLNPNYYAKVERGDGIPSLKTLVKIARALEVTVTEIVGY